MDSAKQNHVRICFSCLITKAKRVADEIGGILQFGNLIIVRQDHGVPLVFELLQLFRQIDAAPVCSASPARIDTEIYTGSNHRLISRKTMDSQPFQGSNLAHVIPSESLALLATPKLVVGGSEDERVEGSGGGILSAIAGFFDPERFRGSE